MLIVLSNYRISCLTALHIAGYDRRPKEGDLIRADDQGRWHAKIVSYKHKIIDVHFDLFVEWRHVSGLYMPIKHNEERRRILRTISRFRKFEMTVEERKRVLRKAGVA